MRRTRSRSARPRRPAAGWTSSRSRPRETPPPPPLRPGTRPRRRARARAARWRSAASGARCRVRPPRPRESRPSSAPPRADALRQQPLPLVQEALLAKAPLRPRPRRLAQPPPLGGIAQRAGDRPRHLVLVKAGDDAGGRLAVARLQRLARAAHLR